jgi:predicted RNA binding protein YcfA (HicA-like mRNA interferase family)
MRARKLFRKLRRAGCIIEPRKGGHHLVTREERRIIVPYHGNKEIGKGLLEKIQKTLDVDL